MSGNNHLVISSTCHASPLAVSSETVSRRYHGQYRNEARSNPLGDLEDLVEEVSVVVLQVQMVMTVCKTLVVAVVDLVDLLHLTLIGEVVEKVALVLLCFVINELNPKLQKHLVV